MRLVAIDAVEPGSVLALDVWGGSSGVTPLLRAGTILRGTYLERLNNGGIAAVYIDDEISAGIEVPIALRPTTHIEAVRVLDAAFGALPGAVAAASGALRGEVVLELKSVVQAIIDDLEDAGDAMLAFADLSSVDAYSMQHSIDVTVLGLVLGKRLFREYGWIDYDGTRRYDRIDERLRRLGLGLLLHDVGKATVPTEVLNKEGPLDINEWELIHAYPAAGAEMLTDQTVGARAKSVVRFHHERYDGTGYPSGLKGEEIPQLARIAAVADVFDAITSTRSYRKAAPAWVGVQEITAGSRTLFDPQVVAVFRSLVAPHPAGTYVTLSDGREGIVAEVPPARADRPVVRVLTDHEGNRLTAPIELPLIRHPEIEIMNSGWPDGAPAPVPAQPIEIPAEEADSADPAEPGEVAADGVAAAAESAPPAEAPADAVPGSAEVAADGAAAAVEPDSPEGVAADVVPTAAEPAAAVEVAAEAVTAPADPAPPAELVPAAPVEVAVPAAAEPAAPVEVVAPAPAEPAPPAEVPAAVEPAAPVEVVADAAPPVAALAPPPELPAAVEPAAPVEVPTEAAPAPAEPAAPVEVVADAVPAAAEPAAEVVTEAVPAPAEPIAPVELPAEPVPPPPAPEPAETPAEPEPAPPEPTPEEAAAPAAPTGPPPPLVKPLIDPLTGLGTRRQLDSDLDRAVARNASPSLLVVFDLDGTGLEDSRSRVRSEALLRLLAASLTRALGDAASCYRSREAELSALIYAPIPIARTLADAAARALGSTDREDRVEIRFGTTVLPREASDPGTAIRMADKRRKYGNRGQEDED